MAAPGRDWLAAPSSADAALWAEVVRGVRPLPGRRRQSPAMPKAAPRPDVEATVPRPAKTPRRPRPAEPATTRPAHVAERGLAGLDKRQADRLRRGEIAIDARLDLHGMTQAAAHRALDAFLGGALAAGRRCVLVITGKGAAREAAAQPGTRLVLGENTGVLRAMLPRWIDEGPHATRVVALQPAHRRHGGGGAFYVYLRRSR
jgi:DNA-nicking Smr family endonuclease